MLRCHRLICSEPLVTVPWLLMSTLIPSTAPHIAWEKSPARPTVSPTWTLRARYAGRARMEPMEPSVRRSPSSSGRPVVSLICMEAISAAGASAQPVTSPPASDTDSRAPKNGAVEPSRAKSGAAPRTSKLSPGAVSPRTVWSNLRPRACGRRSTRAL